MTTSTGLVGSKSFRFKPLKMATDSDSRRGVFTDPDLGPVMYYHYVDTTIGYADNQKLFGWKAVDFSSGWPVV